jgi:hypothetical protein
MPGQAPPLPERAQLLAFIAQQRDGIRYAAYGLTDEIVRESIDGETTYELMAAAEGWPATDYAKPWEPKP